MGSVSKVALSLALAFGGAASLGIQPAHAQEAEVELSQQERTALRDFQDALQMRNYAAATSAMNAAQSVARSGYSRYLASALQLRLGIETGNIGLQTTAIEAMIGSGAVPAAEMPQLYRNYAAVLQDANRLDRAEAAYVRYLEMVPGDAEALVAYSKLKADRKRGQEALTYVGRAIAARQAAGQPVPESWYKRGINLSLAHQNLPQAVRWSRELVAAYPSAMNWRDALLVYRDASKADQEAVIDSWRLMRASKALAGERDYLQYAQALTGSGLAAESRAILEQGVAAKMVDPGKATFKELIASSAKQAATERAGAAARQKAAMAAATGAPALTAGNAALAQGDYTSAASLYGAAVQKGGVDANLANTRRGIALALAGQRAEAEAAFRSVTGTRAELASLWLAWLAQRG